MDKQISVSLFHTKDAQSSNISVEVGTGVETFATLSRETAFIANDSWQSIGPILGAAEMASASDITLLDVPDVFLAGIKKRIEGGDNDLLDALGPLSRVLSDWLVDQKLSFHTKLLGSGITFHGPGQRSTAYDPVHGEYRGLHIDDHEKAPLDQRGACFLLLNVNLGDASRFLQFIPLTVEGLRLTLHQDCGLNTEGLSAKDLKNAFFTSNPNTIVWRVAIPPGAAYLAQTQNLIHDGATNTVGLDDVSLQLAFSIRRD